MVVTALVSGGKDSCYSAYLADCQGRTVDELLVLRPSDPDSLLFHTPNLELVELQARAWGKECRFEEVKGIGERAETEALERALRNHAGWVVAGAIASAYQWTRLHSVCYQLGRPLFTPLWGKAAPRVVRAEIDAGLDIRLVHLSAEPLGSEWIGRRLDLATLGELERLSQSVRAVHVAGEGGEFESLVLDAPFFRERLVLDRTEVITSRSVTSLRVREAHLEPKTEGPGRSAPPPA